LQATSATPHLIERIGAEVHVRFRGKADITRDIPML